MRLLLLFFIVLCVTVSQATFTVGYLGPDLQSTISDNPRYDFESSIFDAVRASLKNTMYFGATGTIKEDIDFLRFNSLSDFTNTSHAPLSSVGVFILPFVSNEDTEAVWVYLEPYWCSGGSFFLLEDNNIVAGYVGNQLLFTSPTLLSYQHHTLNDTTCTKVQPTSNRILWNGPFGPVTPLGATVGQNVQGEMFDEDRKTGATSGMAECITTADGVMGFQTISYERGQLSPGTGKLLWFGDTNLLAYTPNDWNRVFRLNAFAWLMDCVPNGSTCSCGEIPASYSSLGLDAVCDSNSQQWRALFGEIQINGTVTIEGNITIGDNVTITLSGEGSLAVNGTIHLNRPKVVVVVTDLPQGNFSTELTGVITYTGIEGNFGEIVIQDNTDDGCDTEALKGEANYEARSISILVTGSRRCDDDDSSSFPGWAIAVIVVPILLIVISLIVLVVVGLFLAYKQRHAGRGSVGF